MANSLRNGDYVVVLRAFRPSHRWVGWWGVPKRGDVLVFRAPFDPQRILVKRIVAVGGDHLRILRGKVVLNGTALEERYETSQNTMESEVSSWPEDIGTAGMRDILIPSGYCFVLGDNRKASMDSRHFGFVPVENFIGKVIFAFRR